MGFYANLTKQLRKINKWNASTSNRLFLNFIWADTGRSMLAKNIRGIHVKPYAMRKWCQKQVDSAENKQERSRKNNTIQKSKLHAASHYNEPHS